MKPPERRLPRTYPQWLPIRRAVHPALRQVMAGIMPACILVVCLGVSAPAHSQTIPTPDCPNFESLCLQAQNVGGIDLKAGTAKLDGDVVGLLRMHDLAFQAQTLTAHRNDQDQWVRLDLEREVVVEQSGRRVQADHATVENDTGRVRFTGRVRLEEANALVEAEDIVVELDPARTIITGGPENPITMRHDGLIESAPPGGNLTDTITVVAQRAVWERDTGRVRYEGGVELRRLELEWRMRADRIDIRIGPERQVQEIRAQGDVIVEQPGRRLQSDEMASGDNMQILILTGHARAHQEGQFDLESDRIEVYADVGKGLVQSEDQNSPIRLTLEVGSSAAYRLDDGDMGRLRSERIPPSTLAKLNALKNRDYQGRAAFGKALKSVLSESEIERFGKNIAAVAREREE